MATTTIAPASFEAAAEALAQATAAGRTVRIAGAGTKLRWGNPVAAELELRTTALAELIEHNAGDLTATLQAGVPLAVAQRTFAGAGQMLALDPPPDPAGATIGGIFATGDCGPLRHRYGAPRDLIVGVTVALSDGTVAKAGGTVIKNVAGYDLAKLFSGSFGTLGLILAVNVRLHPRPERTATALASTAERRTLAAAAVALAGSPGEFEALDVHWADGRGELLARCAGPEAGPRSRRAAQLMAAAGLDAADVADDDEPLWARQRAGQRSPARAIVRVSARPSALAEVVASARECGGTLVGRAALGSSYIELDPDAVPRLRQLLAPSASSAVLLDPGAAAVRADAGREPPSPVPVPVSGAEDAWGPRAPGLTEPALELMRRVKARFDPAGTCNPGVFVGGI
jgi:glycolate dehydrogenase FAD-binding subunit